MDAARKDSHRAAAAASCIFDGRDPRTDNVDAAVLVTLEHAIATVLLALCNQNPRQAALILNEGLVPGIEERLMLYTQREKARYEDDET